MNVRTLIFVFGLALLFSVEGRAWSAREHSAIALIAESHLTPSAKAKVKEILGGRSLLYYASWLDDYRADMSVYYVDDTGTSRKHSIPHIYYVDENLKVNADLQKGTVYHLNHAIENLKDYKNISDSLRLVSMQYVIHLVGDIHCPCHIRYADMRDCGVDKSTTKGLGLFEFQFKGQKNNGHWLWDTGLLTALCPGGVFDLAYEVSYKADKKYIRAVSQGSPIDWAQEVVEQSCHIWDGLSTESRIGREYMAEHKDLAYDLIFKAGIRLAATLNMLF